jgi:hypothetical protein
MNHYPLGPIQILSILGSATLIAGIFLLIRKKKLKEEYAILWLVVFFMFLIISIFRSSIDFISKILGIAYQPSSLFIVLIIGAFLLLLHFSVIISDLRTKMNRLVSELTLVRSKLEDMEKKEISS